jgi:hypothetical protein
MEIRDLDSVQEIKNKASQEVVIPNGYIPIKLSTLGKLGVPAEVHCRNFNTADLVDLSMYVQDALPERLIGALNSIIFEKDVNVANWPDKVVVELLIKVYINFFTPLLPDVNFPWNEEDIKWLEEHDKQDQAISLQEGKWRPKFDLNVKDSVKIMFLSDEVKEFITVRKKNNQGIEVLNAKFVAYPKYGDVLTLRQAVESKFSEEDKKYARIKQQFEMRERYLDEGKDISFLQPLDDIEFRKWQLYEATKSKYATRAAEAIYLIKYNDMDLSKVSIDERIKYIDSPLFDAPLSRLIDTQYKKIEFGLNPEIEIKNPITGEVCKRRFTFQLLDILQAIQSQPANGYDISFDD